MPSTTSLSTEAEHWRSRAEEQRTVAKTMTNAHCRATFLAMAESSERSARLAEDRAAVQQRQRWQQEYDKAVALERFILDRYLHDVRWIVHERAGMGGWPPRDVMKVSGWVAVRQCAASNGRPVREVARDVIQYALTIGE